MKTCYFVSSGESDGDRMLAWCLLGPTTEHLFLCVTNVKKLCHSIKE